MKANPVSLSGEQLLEMLEDNDDVQNVYHNAELPEEEDDED